MGKKQEQVLCWIEKTASDGSGLFLRKNAFLLCLSAIFFDNLRTEKEEYQKNAGEMQEKLQKSL